jgi:hypothetical protein
MSPLIYYLVLNHLFSPAGLVTEASETLDIKGVVLSHGINGFFQRGPQLGEENVNQAISGAATDWVPPEQVLLLHYLNGLCFQYDLPYDVSLYSPNFRSNQNQIMSRHHQ